MIMDTIECWNAFLSSRQLKAKPAALEGARLVASASLTRMFSLSFRDRLPETSDFCVPASAFMGGLV